LQKLLLSPPVNSYLLRPQRHAVLKLVSGEDGIFCDSLGESGTGGKSDATIPLGFKSELCSSTNMGATYFGEV